VAAIEDVLKYITANEIKWLDLQFFGIDGAMHSVSISKNDIDETIFTKGVYAADLVEVFGKSEQGELLLLPDPETMARIPWEQSSARLLCDVISSPSGERFLRDPRYIVERMETNLSAVGVKNAMVGAELEFYIFDNVTTDRTSQGNGGGTLIDSREAVWGPSPFSGKKTGSFVSTPTDSLYPARVQISNTLEETFGIEARTHHHGRSQSGQQCIELRDYTLKNAADAVSTTKFVARNLSSVSSAFACFMPYPIENEKGSTLVIRQSLWKSGEANVFYAADEEYSQLSQTARYYIGGLLEHAGALSVFTNPTTNSYKRLAADGRFVGWSKSNKLAAVHVPFRKKNDKENKSVEYTLADPSVNPYLAYAAVVSAGLDGIKNKTDCGDPAEKADEVKKAKSKKLPENLKEAIAVLETDSKFLKGIFSSEILGDYIALKLTEHREGSKALSGWELNKYWGI